MSKSTTSALCLLLCSVAFAQGAPRPPQAGIPKSSTATNSESVIAFLSLTAIRNAFSTAANQTNPGSVSSSHATRPSGVPQGNASNPSKDDFLKLYTSLKKLSDSKGTYTEALRLYVDGRKRNLSPAKLDDRERAFENQLRMLNQNLQGVRTAFEPLRIPLNFSSRNGSKPHNLLVC